uniref:Alpha-(1,6)-fucosyltransferase n=1 Tax=Plectus sambesii TaxID=2011161 RepID=A0A914XIW6_9BILA
MADELRLADVDGSGFRREIQLKNLSNLMQKRLISLQNPRHCASARKLQCYINKSCGFGCQLHHVAYCLIFAYATERTLILEGNGQTWDYSRKGWTAAFLPVSDTCLDNGTEEAKFWNSLEESKNHPVISLPVIDELRNGPSFLPQSIPKDLAADLLRLHGYPPAWFVGHFVDYLMRSSPQMKKMLSIAENKVNFAKGPIVGLQVRRTDKIGSEAAFHDVEEYMVWADHWFAVQSLKQGKQLRKRVFVATDEPAVITEIKERYKEYDVIANSNSAILANLQDRYTESSLFGVVADIRLLSNCNYLVCTFSSQICRLAYELMQVRRGDAAASFHSLDDIYYFGGQQAREQEAILSHSPINEDEIELQVGDIIVIAGNHWNGMSKGRNKRTNREGLYPSYKVKENWRIEKFPSYPNVKI